MRKSLSSMIATGFGALTTKAAVSAMSAVNTSGLVREPFAGAWQRNIQVDTREAVLAFAAVYSCVTRIASDIAKMRIKLMRYTEDGIWIEVAGSSPFWPVLRKPNAWQNRIQFLTEWVLMKLLYGNAYILKERDLRGVVVAMYVLDSRRVKPLVTNEGDVYYQLQQDDLAGVKGGPVVPATEIIHDRGPTLWHPLVGVSPIYACGASATQGIRIQANSAKFFENMSRPGGVLSVPGDIDDTEFARMKNEWNESYSQGNVGKTAVLTNGMKYEPFAVAAQDAQLIEQLRWTVEDVARAFGVPLYKIGAGPVPTSNNAEALQQQYYNDCLHNAVECIELCLDEGLRLDQVPGQTLGTELDIDALVRMDTAAQTDALVKQVSGGLRKPNEGRRALNLPPVAGGDTVYLQQQNYSLEALAKRDAQPDPFAPAKLPTQDPVMPEDPEDPADPADTAGTEEDPAPTKAADDAIAKVVERIERAQAEQAGAFQAERARVADLLERIERTANETKPAPLEKFAHELVRGLKNLEVTCG